MLSLPSLAPRFSALPPRLLPPTRASKVQPQPCWSIEEPPAGRWAPIVDLRSSQRWLASIPSRIGTASLWLGAGLLIGPLKLGGLVVLGSLMVVPLASLEERQRQARAIRPGSASSLPLPVLRLASPEGGPISPLGLPENMVFRGRHATICTVHHDDWGNMVRLETSTPCTLPSRRPDAHPVG